MYTLNNQEYLLINLDWYDGTGDKNVFAPEKMYKSKEVIKFNTTYSRRSIFPLIS